MNENDRACGDRYIGIRAFDTEEAFEGYADVLSVKGDRYFCLTSLAVCIACKGCDKKGE